MANMRRILCLAILLCLALPARPALAKLRWLGTFSDVGLFDDDVSHIAIVLEGCEWEAVVSQDGGQTWRIGDKAQLPNVLGKLPVIGQIRYAVTGPTGSLIRSDDGGQSWRDVSPWSFLRRTIREDVKAEKQLYLSGCGHWLPDDAAWPLVFAASALALTAFGVGGCWRQPRQWVLPVLFSLMAYFLTGIGLCATHHYFIRWLCIDQWTVRLEHWDGLTFPLWPLGVLLNLTGNVWLAPVTAILCYPMTPVFGWLARRPSTSARATLRTVAAVVAVVILPLLLILSITPGIGRGWDYALYKSESGHGFRIGNGRHPPTGEGRMR
jgi:hypothetical protein